MNIFNSIYSFVKNGANVFASAARGEYIGVSAVITQIQLELDNPVDGPVRDKLNLRLDRAKISGDVNQAFEKYKKSITL